MKKIYILLLPLILFGCSDNGDDSSERNTPSPNTEVTNSDYYTGDQYQLVRGCYSLHHDLDEENVLVKSVDRYQFEENETGTPFFFQATDLGEYLIYDNDKQFLSSDDGQLQVLDRIVSEMLLPIAETISITSPAEWRIIPIEGEGPASKFHLFNIETELWLSSNSLSAVKSEAQPIILKSAENCAIYPESGHGSFGEITKLKHDDGTLWGYSDAHTHTFNNFASGGRIMHGAAFHKFGIEHALADCDKKHGPHGHYDVLNAATATHASNTPNFPANHLFKQILDPVGEFNHSTSGYPLLTDWSTHITRTHQQMYYKWIERAYRGGLRFMIDYMISSDVTCELWQTLIPLPSDYESCNEMDSIDFQIGKYKEMERYIDAQSGGPGKGWFRLANTPEQARDIVAQGKLAVVLGLEMENPFNCFATDRPGFPKCTHDDVRERLKKYYDLGIRAIFPAHLFRNGFVVGDGNTAYGGAVEFTDFLNSSRWRNYVDCDDVPGLFTGVHGEGYQVSTLGNLFDSLEIIPGLNDTLSKLLRFFGVTAFPNYPDAEAHCQPDGFTDIGRTLIYEMMKLGMIIDMGHLPRAALNNIVPWLLDNEYPAIHTHDGDPRLMKLVGAINSGTFGTDICRSENGDSEVRRHFEQLSERLDYSTGFSRQAFSYDFNGFAGYESPRFGPMSRCKNEQSDPLIYPFTSLGGDIVFEKLQTGDRVFDFNKEGLSNIGLMPDLIEEARLAGVSELDINLYFKSADAYITLWEKMDVASQSVSELEDNIQDSQDTAFSFFDINRLIAFVMKLFQPLLTDILVDG